VKQSGWSKRAPAPPCLLLVEDDDDLCELLREMLGRWGFEVMAARSARTAFAKAAARPPDVALIDIGLPDRDGYDVARTLRRRLPPEARLIAMSGYSDRCDSARVRAAGFDEFLVKPLQAAHLHGILSEFANLRS